MARVVRSNLVRKNLIVDPNALSALARQRGTSESEAVRQAVAAALGLEEMAQAMEEMHKVGAFEHFERLFGPSGDDSAELLPDVPSKEADPDAKQS